MVFNLFYVLKGKIPLGRIDYRSMKNLVKMNRKGLWAKNMKTDRLVKYRSLGADPTFPSEELVCVVDPETNYVSHAWASQFWLDHIADTGEEIVENREKYPRRIVERY
jgi:hypothetical protein